MKPFIVRGKGRHYKSPNTGKAEPSVTNILSCYPKQDALVPWSANVQKELDVAAAYDVYNSGLEFRNAEHFRQVLDDFIGKQRKHKTELKKAGDLGTKVHAAIQNFLQTLISGTAVTTEKLEDKALWAFIVWRDWWRECDIVPIEVEKFVFSDIYGFGGTTDLLARVTLSEALLKRLTPELRSLRVMRDLGETFMMCVDFKTSKGLYPDNYLQIAAYMTALIEMGDLDESAWGMMVRLPKVEEDPEFEVRFLLPEDRARKLEVFLGVKKIWEDKHE